MKSLVLFSTLSFAFAAHADYPKNSLWIPDTNIATQSMNETKFQEAIDLVQKAYGPILKEKLGCTLEIKGDWDDGTVNAYASRDGDVCHVEMFGGFARYPGMTKSAFTDVICHEVGHHLGGEPKYGGEWASCEGQADYWAQECMDYVAPGKAHAAGLVLGKTLAELSGEPEPSYSTPDQSKVQSTYCGHPTAQCRVDTYLAGILGNPRPSCWYAESNQE